MMTDDNNTKKEPKLIIEANDGPEKADKTLEATPHEDEGLSLKEVIREQAIEDESPLASNFTLRKILGGDILSTRAIRRQVPLFLLITVFLVIYVSNRYSCQKYLIEIVRANSLNVVAKATFSTC